MKLRKNSSASWLWAILQEIKDKRFEGVDSSAGITVKGLLRVIKEAQRRKVENQFVEDVPNLYYGLVPTIKGRPIRHAPWDWTDRFRRAINNLIKCGLIQVEYKGDGILSKYGPFQEDVIRW